MQYIHSVVVLFRFSADQCSVLYLHRPPLGSLSPQSSVNELSARRLDRLSAVSKLTSAGVGVESSGPSASSAIGREVAGAGGGGMGYELPSCMSGFMALRVSELYCLLLWFQLHITYVEPYPDMDILTAAGIG